MGYLFLYVSMEGEKDMAAEGSHVVRRRQTVVDT